ncbi:hypothetical protein FZEAL_712 [Fusarium zealandicum]|uniref:Pantothenate kinase n=1 Tax=Fusarium zealandicum TaxID=1053134 RepID=A0A8H4XPJ6_9HYPO|nr:hypothetical protein FZEAL_712 [Fusarium zealandicum]
MGSISGEASAQNAALEHLMTPVEILEMQDVLAESGHESHPRLPGEDCKIFTCTEDKVVPSMPPSTYPYLLVNIGSGVSFYQVSENNQCERITGSSFGGSALGGLLLLLTRARTFEEMLELAEKGENANVDKLIGDIYGMDYSRIGMKMTAVASTFCKAFSMEHRPETATEAITNPSESAASFSDADICRSLVFAVFNNIGQIATLQSRVYDNADIYFTGPYVRDRRLIIETLCIAVRYYSGGQKRAHVMSNQSQADGSSV